MKKSKWVASSLVASLILSSLSACSSNPLAKTPTDAEINAEAEKAYADVKAKSKMSTNAQWNAMVQRVAKRIQSTVNEPTFKWETVVIESPEVNAWCMPGGKIAVYTGIMPVLKTEGALAAVLGHEVSHATLRHGKQQYARAMNENLIGMGVAAATIVGGQLLCKSDMCKLATGLGGAAAGFAITFFNLKYSRGDESAADKQGQLYMAQAGYDPAEAIKLWDRMGAAGGSKPPELLSDHPSDANRKSNLTAWLPDAQAAYSNAPAHYGTGEAIQ